MRVILSLPTFAIILKLPLVGLSLAHAGRSSELLELMARLGKLRRQVEILRGHRQLT
jgi:hypothetical protein